MHLELVDSLSLAGDAGRPNEDAFAHNDGMGVVLDGATPLGEPLLPGSSDAQWIARFGVRRLLAHHASGLPARRALRAALQDAEDSFKGLRRRPPKQRYETPCASMMLAALDDDGATALWFGDCTLLTLRSGETFSLGEGEARRAVERGHARAADPATGAAGKGVREQFLPSLRERRNRINSKAGGWLFSPDVTASSHVRSRTFPAAPGDMWLIASDGFMALAHDYQARPQEDLIGAALAGGLAELGRTLRVIENEDPDGARFPRFKRSDDATAILLRVGA